MSAPVLSALSSRICSIPNALVYSFKIKPEFFPEVFSVNCCGGGQYKKDLSGFHINKTKNNELFKNPVRIFILFYVFCLKQRLKRQMQMLI